MFCIKFDAPRLYWYLLESWHALHRTTQNLFFTANPLFCLNECLKIWSFQTSIDGSYNFLMIRCPCFVYHALMVKSNHVYCDQLCGYFDILGDSLILLISPVFSSSAPNRDGVNRNCIIHCRVWRGISCLVHLILISSHRRHHHRRTWKLYLIMLEMCFSWKLVWRGNLFWGVKSNFFPQI